ncbi:MAG: hypothetical protein K2H29_04635 [Oscillospiraceae bacterium]|nr:hypothetical protein [Oscillospiraceae bacterium]
MSDIRFQNSIAIQDLQKKYKIWKESFINLLIGYDEKIYLLYGANETNSKHKIHYSVLELEIDWDSGMLLQEKFYSLGKFSMQFQFVQPLQDKLLLVSSTSHYSFQAGEQKNAVLLDRMGNLYHRFCLGDGISDYFVLSDGRIITSYFVEGMVGGHHGWEHPIGKSGLIIWDDAGQMIWDAEKYGILEYYAMNIDDAENLWFYYYPDFHLIRTDGITDHSYQPHIEEAENFFFTKDTRHIIFLKNQYQHLKFSYASLNYQKIGMYQKLRLQYPKKMDTQCRYAFRNAKIAVFHPQQQQLFAKEVISI